MSEYTLVDLVICAASQAWKNNGEVLATGIGVVPRLAASLAMKTCNPDMLMTDSEAWMVSEPVPVGPRGDYKPQFESWMGFSRIFDNVWSGKRHAMVGPTQIDRFGQANISMIGSDYKKPKTQMLGVRGFPGNSISHANSFFVPNHNKKVFVENECDMVASIGYNPARLPKGWSLQELVDIRWIITNLCILDFSGPNHQVAIHSLHPGVTVEQVVENTGFPLHIPANIPTTAEPTAEQLALLAQLDPHNIRATALG
ncbi:MAG: ketoacid CoA transferase [Pseudomonadales bacterium]